MRYLLALIVIAAVVAASSSAALEAQGKSGARPHGPKVAATHGPKTTTPRGPKAVTAQGPKTTTARGPKTTTTGPKAPVTTRTKTTGPKSTAARPSESSARGKKATPPAPGSSTTAVPGMPGNGLPKNPQLVERLRALLPPGTDVTAAATGFKNQGQFVAAVHVSDNLGLPFAELRTRMVDQNMSLGQAIQQLRPDVDAGEASRRAMQQADDDLATGGVTRPRSRP